MALSANPPGKRPWLAIAVLVGLTAVAYLPVLRNGFVWDDDTSLTQNTFIKSADGLHQFWFSTRTPDYWPVTASTLWVEWRLWGMNPLGYHVTNLSLHIGEALLLWAILRRLRVPGAYLGALLFAVHPVNVESVAWITQRKNLMAMLFYLLSIGCFLRTKWIAPDDKSASEKAYWLSLITFTLAVLSKGSVVILPVVLLGIIAWKRRIEWRDILRLVPYFAVAGVLTLVNIWFQAHQLGATETVRNAGALERLLGAGAVVWFYLFKALLPIGLTFFYSAWHIQQASVLWWLPLLGALALTAYLWRTSRGALFAWGYFCVALLPVMGFTDVYFMKFSLVADHYQHLALIGATAMAGVGWEQWRRQSAQTAWPVAVIVIGLLAGLTWHQCLRYRDGETLLETTLTENPGSWLAHNNLGVILADAHRLPEAEGQFAEALRLEPDYADAQRNFGLTLAREGRVPEAIPHYEEALRLQPDFVNAHDDLGNALLWLDRAADAVPHFEEAIRLNPYDAEAQCNLGIALVRTNRVAEAIPHYLEAVRLDPDNAVAHMNLANVFMQASRPTEAIPQYEEVLRIRPDDADARSNLESARQALAAPGQ